MVGQNPNKYDGGEICYSVIYYGILDNIGVLCFDVI